MMTLWLISWNLPCSDDDAVADILEMHCGDVAGVNPLKHKKKTVNTLDKDRDNILPNPGITLSKKREE